MNVAGIRVPMTRTISLADIGYESEAAFNRAFKREFGQPPGRYRSDHRNSLARNGKNDF
jgi:AraC-like DNA-binding protein